MEVLGIVVLVRAAQCGATLSKLERASCVCFFFTSFRRSLFRSLLRSKMPLLPLLLLVLVLVLVLVSNPILHLELQLLGLGRGD